MVLQRNADEQDQASSATGGWGWPGDLGAQPWFLRPGGGLPDPGMTPVSPHNGAGPRWSFPNPFAEYRGFVEKTPIWPISVGTAIAMTPLGAAMDRADVTALAFDDRLGPGDKLAESAHLAVDLGGGGLRQAGFDTRNPALYLGGVAVSQWGDVVSEAAKADFSRPTVANNVDFITAHPGEAFAAARDAVLGYLPTLISNFTVNPFGK
ncbi:hypothetical protein [Mycolicibacter acidiphilus]|nr:hypothetical protein [Mycolicibacter acidiphilus]